MKESQGIGVNCVEKRLAKLNFSGYQSPCQFGVTNHLTAAILCCTMYQQFCHGCLVSRTITSIETGVSPQSARTLSAPHLSPIHQSSHSTPSTHSTHSIITVSSDTAYTLHCTLVLSTSSCVGYHQVLILSCTGHRDPTVILHQTDIGTLGIVYSVHSTLYQCLIPQTRPR